MPKISEAKRETRRQEILDAALRCFSRDGFHNTTTADIVRESGVSQGTLYLYFATKEDIVVALADERHQGEAMINALAQGEQDPIRGLLALIERGQHTGQIRAEANAEAVARTLVATFQGLVLQVAWGETVDLRACGQVVLDMLRALLTPEGRASFEAGIAAFPIRAN